MQLLDLPTELLLSILECIGPISLRSSVDNLLVSKQWYRAAIKVFLSDLDLSTLYLSTNAIERLPPPNCPLYEHFSKNVENIPLCL